MKSFPQKVILALACLVLAAPLPALAAEFSARFTVRNQGRVHQGRLWIKGDLARVAPKGGRGYFLFNATAPRLFLVVPKAGIFARLPTGDLKPMSLAGGRLPGEVSRRFLGTGQVRGRGCDIFLVKTRIRGNSATGRLWVDRRLGFPLRYHSKESGVKVTLTNIAPGRLADSLFRPPEGMVQLKGLLPEKLD